MSQQAIVITDRKPGHENQALALCALLDWQPQLVPISATRLQKALFYVWDRVGKQPESAIPGDLPAQASAVVAAGSTTFFPAACVAARLQVPLIVILYPRGFRLEQAACILVPEFDRPAAAPNIVPIPANLCARDKPRLRDCAAEFRDRHTSAKPAVGVMIGGPNRVSEIDCDALREQLQRAFCLLPDHEFWLTTSRRTPDDVVHMLHELPFAFSLIFSEQDRYNPIPYFIEACDRLLVTSDSSSMISEAVTFGQAAVEVLPNRVTRPGSKFDRFLAGLVPRKAVHIFDGSLGDSRTKLDLSFIPGEVRRCISSNFSPS